MPALATANGFPIIDIRLSLPRAGVWHADLAVETDELLDGRVEVVLSGATFVGAVREGGATIGAWGGRLSGGAGGLRETVPAKQYREVPISVPLGDILSASGEQLSRSADKSVTSRQLRAWVMRAGGAGEALAALMKGAESGWRVLPDGTLWVGTETWKPISGDFEVLVDDPRERKVVLAAESLGDLVPGRALFGKHVSYVTHQLLNNALRTTVLFE